MHPALTSFKGDMMNAPAQSLTNHLFHQMKIGDHASLSRHVGPEDIELFAAVSGDANPAHLDANFAAHGPFGHVVIHGMWTAALISAVLGTRLCGAGQLVFEGFCCGAHFRSRILDRFGTPSRIVTDVLQGLRHDGEHLLGTFAEDLSRAGGTVFGVLSDVTKGRCQRGDGCHQLLVHIA